eukprot:CAMPEP_0201591574 /NCGR_PEP_ID=MMETSP0190_2-20130828/189713_1 /ASSEMBLY_ACC=CAM_ASM_000263 /TAXON_ID=37353 /ORGANISM="Rosalina sp." /LENGTH=376 /DNA_ID=CAMNT_0048049967 /DNA_START=259 /DNA_END=1389 /DNA_ORIENTATION=+
MAQPYWITQLDLCKGKNPFDVVNIEPKDPQFYQEIVEFKSQNPKLKVIISIGGWNFPSNFWSQMASDVSSRTAFIASAKAFIQQYKFDGLDIDWEFPGSPARLDQVKITCTQFDQTQDAGGSPQDGANFVELVKEMRTSFGDDLIITVASQADCEKATTEDIKGLFDYIDMFNLMSYDYTVSDIAESPITAPNEPLYPPPTSSGVWNDSVSVTIDCYLDQGIPAEKMSVGIAYYGHLWYAPGLAASQDEWCKFGIKTQVQGKCCGPFAQTYGTECGKYSGLCGTYMYSEIQAAGFETCFDNTTNSAIGYMVSPKDGYTAEGVWISYQDNKTVAAIVDYGKGKGLGGAFAFDISMDSQQWGNFNFELTHEIANLLQD